MAKFRQIELNGTCTAGGALTLTSENLVGYLEKIQMDYADGATGADFVITAISPVVEPVLTVTNAGVADVTWYPRVLANKVADASAFTDVAQRIYMNGQLKIVVAQGGASKDFKFLVVINDD